VSEELFAKNMLTQGMGDKEKPPPDSSGDGLFRDVDPVARVQAESALTRLERREILRLAVFL
jgi:hypothetical protein